MACCGNNGGIWAAALVAGITAGAGLIFVDKVRATDDGDHKADHKHHDADQAHPRHAEGAHAGQAMMNMDLPGAIAETDGCLGVETAQTSGGKQVIFAWFEDKKAVKNWYYSDAHMGAMKMFFPEDDGDHNPLAGVPNDSGPLMVIASITMKSDGTGDFEATTLPISQIAIEVYQPVTGGVFLGSRFAPHGVKVKGLKDYTPKG